MFSVCRHWRKHPKDPKKTERETIYIRIDLVYHHMKNYIYVRIIITYHISCTYIMYHISCTYTYIIVSLICTIYIYI